MSDELIRNLRNTRSDYDKETRKCRFFLDAYSGTGGFDGEVNLPPSSWWGWAADVYSSQQLLAGLHKYNVIEHNSYLDKFPREDDEKFRRRKALAQYPNLCAPVVDIPQSYMFKKEFKRTGVPDDVQSWMEDVDGEGTSWDEMVRDVIMVRAATCGYCPVLFEVVSDDGSVIEEGATLAQAETRVQAVPLFPANLLDWSCDESGAFLWVKVKTTSYEQPDPLRPGRKVERIRIIDRESWSLYVIAKDDSGADVIVDQKEGGHDFGVVPIEVMRWQGVSGDKVRGVSALQSAAQIAKRIYNYLSELDEHIRQTVFAMLQIPMKEVDSTKAAEILAGSGQGLPVPHDANRDYMWIAPPSTVAEVIEKRIEKSEQSIAQVGGIEFTQAKTSGTGQARSGLSRSFEFETANRKIAGIAKRYARFDERSLRMVTRVVAQGTTLSEVRTIPPTKFSIEEIAKDIEDALGITDLDLGPLAHAEMKKRLVRKLLPNLDAEQLAAIDAEIDQREAEAEQAKKQAAAALAEIASAGVGDNDDDDGGDGDEDDPTARAAA